jgi:hypothetical protein
MQGSNAKTRRQGFAITKAKQQVLSATYRFRCPRHPSRIGLFAMDAQKPDNGARLSRDPGKNFFEVWTTSHFSTDS